MEQAVLQSIRSIVDDKRARNVIPDCALSIEVALRLGVNVSDVEKSVSLLGDHIVTARGLNYDCYHLKQDK